MSLYLEPCDFMLWLESKGWTHDKENGYNGLTWVNPKGWRYSLTMAVSIEMNTDIVKWHNKEAVALIETHGEVMEC